METACPPAPLRDALLDREVLLDRVDLAEAEQRSSPDGGDSAAGKVLGSTLQMAAGNYQEAFLTCRPICWIRGFGYGLQRFLFPSHSLRRPESKRFARRMVYGVVILGVDSDVGRVRAERE